MKKRQLAQIVASASTLHERLSDPNIIPKKNAGTAQRKKIDNRLARWLDLAAEGSQEKFQKLLEWRKLMPEQLSAILGKVELKDKKELPAWAHILDEVLQSGSLRCEAPPIDPEDPLPFEDILLPIISVARNKLGGPTYAQLERALLKQLSRICSAALHREFSFVRPAGYEFLSCLVGAPDQGDQHYRTFVEEMRQEKKWQKMFQKYPVMGRLVSTAVEYWTESTAEFLSRLREDLQEIEKAFGIPGRPLGSVVHIETSLSDLHHRGRSVLIVTFESGLKVVYKPRDLGISEAYNTFLDWCNVSFKVVKVLNRAGYGWEEFIEYFPCKDEQAVKRFYERAGRLLCLLYVLQAKDCHFENLIAHGEYPVIVDPECLMYPILKKDNEDFFSRSVFSIGLLPHWVFKGTDKKIVLDISGFGSAAADNGGIKESKWNYINTDSMVEMIVPKTFHYKNAPMLEGKRESSANYVEELISGFRQMYLFFLEKREELVSELSPLQLFQNKKIRFLCRDTSIYAGIQYNASLLDYLREGVDRSIELERLSCAFLQDEERTPLFPFFEMEMQSMENMDIPHLAITSDECVFNPGSKHSISEVVRRSGYEEVIEHVREMGQEDLNLQVLFIHSAFNNLKAYAHVPEKPHKSNATDAKFPLLRSDEFLMHAREIAEEIQRYTLKDSEGNVKWISPVTVRGADRFRMQVLREDFFDGNTGIALFLAALHSVSPDADLQRLALSALQPTRESLIKDSSNFAKRLGIGGLTGLGSIVYGLTRVGRFLGDEELLHDAQQMAELITPELIHSDEKLDVVFGSAGTILALLALYSVNNNPSLVEKANLCGRHILKQKSLTSPGFAHGTAGTSYALWKLYEETRDESYLKASLYRKGQLQQISESGSRFLWCNGAVGIALAGMSMPSWKEAFVFGLETAKQGISPHRFDHVCCGNFGSLNFLWFASEAGYPHLRPFVLQKASELVARRKEQGSYQFLQTQTSAPFFKPGFMQGLAGIGYELLRYTQLIQLPNVLLLE